MILRLQKATYPKGRKSQLGQLTTKVLCTALPQEITSAVLLRLVSSDRPPRPSEGFNLQEARTSYS
jgi:hypothetical protein